MFKSAVTLSRKTRRRRPRRSHDDVERHDSALPAPPPEPPLFSPIAEASSQPFLGDAPAWMVRETARHLDDHLTMCGRAAGLRESGEIEERAS